MSTVIKIEKNEQIEKLKELLKILGLTQKRLSIGLRKGNQSFISKVLHGDRDFSEEQWHDLLTILKQSIQTKKQEHPFPNRLEAESLLRDLEDAHGIRSLSFSQPGRPLTSSEVNYIKRACDETAQRSFIDGLPFFLNIVGPPQSGKTSLMASVAKMARIQGIKTHVINLRLLRSLIDSKYVDFLRAFLFELQQIRNPKRKIEKYGGIDETLAIVEFENMILAEIRHILRESPFILFIDSLHLLYRDVTTTESTEKLRNLLHLLMGWNDLFALDDSYRNFGFVTAITPASIRITKEFSDSGSLFLTRAALSVRNFSKIEVELFAKSLDLLHSSISQRAWELFEGQPYLTHLFLYEIHSGKEPKVVEAAALKLKGGFGAHWRRLKAEIKKDPGFVLKKKGGGWIQLKAIAQRKVKTEDLEYLFLICLCDYQLMECEENECRICGEFYRNAILNGKTLTDNAIGDNCV